jgi:hypothetical protein
VCWRFHGLIQLKGSSVFVSPLGLIIGRIAAETDFLLASQEISSSKNLKRKGKKS